MAFYGSRVLRLAGLQLQLGFEVCIARACMGRGNSLLISTPYNLIQQINNAKLDAPPNLIAIRRCDIKLKVTFHNLSFPSSSFSFYPFWIPSPYIQELGILIVILAMIILIIYTLIISNCYNFPMQIVYSGNMNCQGVLGKRYLIKS